MWGKIASEWSGKGRLELKGKWCQTAEDKRDSVTVSLLSAKHRVFHRPKIGESVKTNKERKEPEILGPPDESMSTHTECTTAQMCGDSNVAEKWIDGHYAMGLKYNGKDNCVSSGTD